MACEHEMIRCRHCGQSICTKCGVALDLNDHSKQWKHQHFVTSKGRVVTTQIMARQLDDTKT